MGAERIDYYSDDDYEHARYLEEEQFYEAMREEEEIEEYYKNEYYKSLELNFKDI